MANFTDQYQTVFTLAPGRSAHGDVSHAIFAVDCSRTHRNIFNAIRYAGKDIWRLAVRSLTSEY